MLEITIQGQELWNDEIQEFIPITNGQKIQLEHSLVSLSKWESKWKTPFLGKNGIKDERTNEQIIDYIRCMTITQNVKPEIYANLDDKTLLQIKDYIADPMTATWFNDRNGETQKQKDTITSEVIYYWMIAQNIPMECQKWHLNRLLTLIRVCGIKNAPPKKIGKRDAMSSRTALNNARRAQLNSKG